MRLAAIVGVEVGALVAVATLSYGLCVQTSASQADTDLWNTHGCWEEYLPLAIPGL